MAGGPNEDDWNRSYGEGSEERGDTGNQRMRRGWLRMAESAARESEIGMI